jgi:hypothetical protein
VMTFGYCETLSNITAHKLMKCPWMWLTWFSLPGTDEHFVF